MHLSTPSVVSVLVVLLLVACNRLSDEDRRQPPLVPEVKLSMAAGGEFTAQLGLRNASAVDDAGSDDFNGVMEIRLGSGQLVLRTAPHAVGPIERGATVFPLEWTGQLEPAEYTLTWQAPEADRATVTLSVVRHKARCSCWLRRTSFSRLGPS